MGKKYLESDIHKAISMFELAAKQGHTYAEYQLGKIYCFGQGVPQSLETGMEWLRVSASHGNEHAAELLEHIQSQSRTMLMQAALSLFQSLAGMISDSYAKQQKQFDQLDSKERQKLNEKKRAQGQKVTGPEMRM